MNDPACAPVKPSDHIPLVAPLPTEPPKAAVVCPWQIADKAEPAVAVGFGFTESVLLGVAVPHDPPLVVNVNVTEEGALAET